MRCEPNATCASAVLFACALEGTLGTAQAQSIEPRSYSNAPVGINFLVAGYAYTRGGLEFDTAVPVTNPDLHTSNAVLAYARVLDFWGTSAKFSAILPYTWLSGSAQYFGQAIERIVSGFNDPIFRLSVNLYGAPALSFKEFEGYQQDLIVGASLRVTAPWGQYDQSKLVNISTNRWTFKPELGISKALGAWTLEGTAAVTLFTDNNEFLGGTTRSQAPLFSTQGHAIYNFSRGMWASLDATYFAGGRSTINDTLNNDLQSNWRLGGTFSFPVNMQNSIRLYASKGVAARTGNNFDLIGIGWQYYWGDGI